MNVMGDVESHNGNAKGLWRLELTGREVQRARSLSNAGFSVLSAGMSVTFKVGDPDIMLLLHCDIAAAAHKRLSAAAARRRLRCRGCPRAPPDARAPTPTLSAGPDLHGGQLPEQEGKNRAAPECGRLPAAGRDGSAHGVRRCRLCATLPVAPRLPALVHVYILWRRQHSSIHDMACQRQLQVS